MHHIALLRFYLPRTLDPRQWEGRHERWFGMPAASDSALGVTLMATRFSSSEVVGSPHPASGHEQAVAADKALAFDWCLSYSRDHACLCIYTALDLRYPTLP